MIKNFPNLLIVCVIACCSLALAKNEPVYGVIPEPAKTVMEENGFCDSKSVMEKRRDDSLPPEGYRLQIKPEGISIVSGDKAGEFYALQTLSQIYARFDKQPLPCGTITDRPRFPWRGMMIDPARHFIPVGDIKKFIDVMAFYKFNKLHIHLTDNQGWRFPVPGYPRLATVASKREQTHNDGKPHGGIYSKRDLKDIVAYAADRHIEVIPEVDTPGHNQALAAAYPELFCYPDKDIKVKTDIGNTPNLVCPGKPEVWKFYKAVFDELADIFPSKYVHLGGDEAPEDHWKTCPTCAEWRKERKIESPAPLEQPASESDKKKYDEEMLASVREEMKAFFRQMGSLLNENGKEGLFWFEDPIADYPKGSTVYTWRMGLTPSTIKKSRESGLKLICAPGEHAYFDYPQYRDDVPKREPGGGWMPVTTLKRAYDFDPGYGLPADEQAHIIGVEATMWAECIPNLARLFYMTYPRSLALIEAGWSPMEVRSWENFLKKIEFHNKLMHEKWGISLHRPGYE